MPDFCTSQVYIICTHIILTGTNNFKPVPLGWTSDMALIFNLSTDVDEFIIQHNMMTYWNVLLQSALGEYTIEFGSKLPFCQDGKHHTLQHHGLSPLKRPNNKSINSLTFWSKNEEVHRTACPPSLTLHDYIAHIPGHVPSRLHLLTHPAVGCKPLRLVCNVVAILTFTAMSLMCWEIVLFDEGMVFSPAWSETYPW